MSIQAEANEFAALLDNTLKHALDLPHQFETPREIKNKDNTATGTFSIALKIHPDTETRVIPLKRKCDKPHQPALFLGVNYTVNRNPVNQYM